MLYSGISAHLLRQWSFCSRIVYYLELTDIEVEYPAWVKQGESFHGKEQILWQRRNLSRFNLADGKLHLNVSFFSDKYKIHGIADMAIETENEVFPVEFKLSSLKQKKGGILQLTAYGMLLEEKYNKTSPFGFLTEGKKIVNKVPFTKSLKKEVLKKTMEISNMIKKGIKPDSSATIWQCSNCEYLNHCNDRG